MAKWRSNEWEIDKHAQRKKNRKAKRKTNGLDRFEIVLLFRGIHTRINWEMQQFFMQITVLHKIWINIIYFPEILFDFENNFRYWLFFFPFRLCSLFHFCCCCFWIQRLCKRFKAFLSSIISGTIFFFVLLFYLALIFSQISFHINRLAFTMCRLRLLLIHWNQLIFFFSFRFICIGFFSIQWNHFWK